jgi:hypothetical protein
MRFSALAGLVLLLPFCWHARGSDLPELAQLKVDAENGNAEAQSRLADRYLSSFEFTNATKWYRLAAEKGNLNAQWNLGVILLKGKPAFPNRSAAVPREPEQGLAWLLKAGAQEHERAQIDLGHTYRDGTAGKQDLREAYKWYSLAARKTRTWKPMYLDPLILRMTTEQIAEGQKRVDAFIPGVETGERLARAEAVSGLVLKSRGRSKGQRLAIFNNFTFETGEEGEVRIGGRPVKVKCLAIGERSATFEVDGQRMELPLKQ